MVNKSLVLSVTLLMAIPAVPAAVVKGTVSLIDYPTALECASLFDQLEAVNPLWATTRIAHLYVEKRHELPRNVEVELQTLPDFEVIGRAKVDANGRYRMDVKDDDRDWRVFCRCGIEDSGKMLEYQAAARMAWNRREEAYVQNLELRRDYASVVGRCVDKDGMPIADAVVKITVIKADSGTSKGEWPGQVARTGKDGIWRADCIPAPRFDRLVTYVCNTNSIYYSALRAMPYGIQIYAHPSHGVFEPSGTASVANVSADGRRAVEHAIAAVKRRTGKDTPRPAPLADFPASTNNVIYVPDIVLK